MTSKFKYKLCALTGASARLMFLAVTCLMIFLCEKCPSFIVICSKTEGHEGCERATQFSAFYTCPET